MINKYLYIDLFFSDIDLVNFEKDNINYSFGVANQNKLKIISKYKLYIYIYIVAFKSLKTNNVPAQPASGKSVSTERMYLLNYSFGVATKKKSNQKSCQNPPK